jgi:hypothetical protein
MPRGSRASHKFGGCKGVQIKAQQILHYSVLHMKLQSPPQHFCLL